MDSNLFSGLEKFGVGDISSTDLFQTEKNDNDKNEEGVEVPPEPTPEEKELEMLLDKSHTCPVCDNSFKNKTVRTGKARLTGIDLDLRQSFEDIEPLKYDVISCPKCGFSAVSRFFVPLTPVSRKNVKEKIGANFKPQEEPAGIYSYEQAIQRYKLALANDMVRNAKASEKAYTCLRAAWLCRSYKDTLEDGETKTQANALEYSFLKNAYEGFMLAITKESFPMCGMDSGTVDYLLAALAYELDHLNVAAKLISSILTSPSSNSRMKDRARDLKEAVLLAAKTKKN